MSDRMTGSQAAIAQIELEGVDSVFGIPGDHNIFLCDAVLDHPDIQFIGGRHEQDITFMANGYARVTGKVAVPIVISGPGVTNSLTSLADAYADSVPMVLLAACPQRGSIGTGAFHEIKNQTGMLAAVTKWNTRVETVEEIPATIRKAFEQAYGGRPGPTAVEIPVDVQREEADVTLIAPVEQPRQSANVAAVRDAAERIARARNPVIYIGSGAAASDCSAELLQLLEYLQCFCFATALGQGVVSADHPQFVGFRWAESGPARSLLDNADLMLVVGSSLDQVETDDWSEAIPENLIQIDTCPEMIGRRYPVSVGLTGDAKTVLQQLLDTLADLPVVSRESVAPRVLEIKKQAYARIQDRIEWQYMDAIQQALPRDAFVFNDASTANMWCLAYLDRYLPRTINITRSMGVLGYAFPSAIGAKVAYPDRQSIAVAGDGGFLFTSNVLTTAVEYKLNAVAIVFNDNCYSSIKRTQDRLRGRSIGVDLHNPDFVKLAEAHGAVGVRVTKPVQLRDALEAAWSRNLPTVIEVPLDMNTYWFKD